MLSEMVFNLAGSDYAQISTLKSLLIRLADLPVDSSFMDAEAGEARRRRKRPGEKQEKLLQVANNGGRQRDSRGLLLFYQNRTAFSR